MLKKVLPLCIAVLLSSNICSAEMLIPSKNIDDEIIKIEKPDQAYTMLNKVRKDRNTIYNVLNFTPQQICKTKQIEECRFNDITPVVNEFLFKKKELKRLQTNNCAKNEINAIKKDMEKLEKKIKKICKKYDKDFEKLLTREQKNKYDMVQRLRFEELKNVKKMQRYSTNKSDLKPFGKNITQSEYLEEIKQERSLKTKCKKLFKKDNNLSEQ